MAAGMSRNFNVYSVEELQLSAKVFEKDISSKVARIKNVI
jgi:hypothetical protein